MRLVRLCLFGLAALVGACSAPAEKPATASGLNIVTIVGAIHGQHRRSQQYSLTKLNDAIVRFNPDIIMVELPPERFAIAQANFNQFGEVRESRTDDFPELIDVVFPLSKERTFKMVPVAAWTQKIADDRRAVLAKLQQDPLRAAQWKQHQAAVAAYNKAVRGRSDDPAFIHSSGYDAAVKMRQENYENLFGDDLGAGGWETINAAHYKKIAAALDSVQGQGKRILILYGAWHKYWILEQLEKRRDIQIVNAARFFDD